MNLFRSTKIVVPGLLIVSGAFAGCTPKAPEAAALPEVELPWVKAGNTYSNDVVYDRPNGVSEDTFTITLSADGKVTAAESVLKGDGGKHDEGLVKFNAALTPVIVGKSISEIEEFDTLGGYSLTTAAFNEAVNNLQQQFESAS